jgi:hypothetical protein
MGSTPRCTRAISSTFGIATTLSTCARYAASFTRSMAGMSAVTPAIAVSR